ncbi:MAG: metallophosphoesterase family protein [Solirubrobacterales bacterium]|nr:metallophosphoesterase family protein [Solirubrobacterales bacterium]
MVALVADTHMPKGARVVPDRCLELLRKAELIVHAGDWWKLEVLEMLESIGPPVVGVHGNVDEPAVRRRLPERAEFALGEHVVGVIHDAGAKRGRLRRMRKAFPDASAVIFGHSHIPLLETDPDAGFTIFNPGSPTDRRRAPAPTMGTLDLGGGGRLRFAHVEV